MSWCCAWPSFARSPQSSSRFCSRARRLGLDAKNERGIASRPGARLVVRQPRRRQPEEDAPMTELYCPSCEALSDGDADRSRDEAAHLPGERSGSSAWRHDRAELPGLTIPLSSATGFARAAATAGPRSRSRGRSWSTSRSSTSTSPRSSRWWWKTTEGGGSGMTEYERALRAGPSLDCDTFVVDGTANTDRRRRPAGFDERVTGGPRRCRGGNRR